MNYDARYFGELFVNVSKKESARVSYHKERVNEFSTRMTGHGHIPYDTGRLQNSIYLSTVTPNSCTVSINGQETPYAVYLQYCERIGNTPHINMHRGFLQKFTKSEFVAELRRKFKEVRVE